MIYVQILQTLLSTQKLNHFLQTYFLALIFSQIYLAK